MPSLSVYQNGVVVQLKKPDAAELRFKALVFKVLVFKKNLGRYGQRTTQPVQFPGPPRGLAPLRPIGS